MGRAATIQKNNRSTARGKRRPFLQWRPSLAVTLFALFAGCGAQELYEPPTAPFAKVGSLALPSEAQGVSLLGDHAFIAAGQAGLIVIDFSDPRNPLLVKTLNTTKYAESILVASTPSAGGVTDIAFVVEGTEGITTYDVTDPANAFSYEQGTTAVDGNGLYVEIPDDPADPYIVYLAESWKGIRIFESDDGIPGLLHYNGVFASTQGSAGAITVKDGFAYVADDEMGLAVLDVRSRMLGDVALVSWCDTPGHAIGVDVAGAYCFIADEENGLVVAEIRQEGEPAMPTPYVVAHLDLPGDSRAIEVRDGIAFIAAEDGGVHFVDVSDPKSPSLLGTVITSYATDIALANSGYVLVSDRDEGFIVLKGPEPFEDYTPPAPVDDLVAAGLDSTTVRLTWTAPGNDGLTGTATQYDVRYSPAAITTAEEWDSATTVEGEPAPSVRGSNESFDVEGLIKGTTYHFALRTADAALNLSELSNDAVGTTASGNVPPSLTGGGVSPEAGTTDSTFTFVVTYTDADGDAPSSAEVAIRTVSATDRYDMTYVSGDYESGALYRFETTISAVGDYSHFFSFDDGHGNEVSSYEGDGPAVGVLLFTMGSPDDEPGRRSDETAHQVVLLNEVEFSTHEVTQAEYDSIMGSNPSRFTGDNRPVEKVSWFDAVAYCNALSLDRGLTEVYLVSGEVVTWDSDADGYRLPTEAEWESYCRAGSQGAFSGGGLTHEACGFDGVLDTLGWYCGNASAATHDVMSLSANAEGLYDMHGNVWEWCWDWYREELGAAVAVDPAGPQGGSQRVIRGGSWYYHAADCRSASRSPYWPNSKDDLVGFRVVRTVR